MRKKKFFWLLAGGMVISASVEARMYQWVNPQSGYTQFSGQPPTWYRSARGGPRVVVFENGKLIDDTARQVSESVRESLRAQAFKKAREVKPPVISEKEKPTAPLPEKAEETEPYIPERIEDHFAKKGEAAEKADAQEPPPLMAPKKPKDPDEETVEQLRAIIAEWDKRRTDEARRLLEAQGKQLPGSPPGGSVAPLQY
jgi:hypothetical protein